MGSEKLHPIEHNQCCFDREKYPPTSRLTGRLVQIASTCHATTQTSARSRPGHASPPRHATSTRDRYRARYGGGAFARLRSASAISRRRCHRIRLAMPSPYARGANRAIGARRRCYVDGLARKYYCADCLTCKLCCPKCLTIKHCDAAFPETKERLFATLFAT